MRNFVSDTDALKSSANEMPVPTSQIHEARKVFPTKTLSFEVLLKTNDPALGFALCARIARAGFHLLLVNYHENGNLFLRINNDASITPERLADLFVTDGHVTILRWTNVFQS